MTRCLSVFLVVLYAAGSILACSGDASTKMSLDPGRHEPRVPVVLELFTSEGCSSCPSADRLLKQLVETQPIDGVELIALGEHVDYWNGLGWRDVLSSPIFTARQTDYQSAIFRSTPLYTPQLVIDGTFQCVGSDLNAIRTAVTDAAHAPRGRLRMEAQSRGAGQLTLTMYVSGLPPPSASADVYVAVTQDGLATQVTRGENGGRRLSHAAVVRTVRVAGATSDHVGSATATIALDPEWHRADLTLVAFVQERSSRRIVAATRQAVPPVASAANRIDNGR